MKRKCDPEHLAAYKRAVLAVVDKIFDGLAQHEVPMDQADSATAYVDADTEDGGNLKISLLVPWKAEGASSNNFNSRFVLEA